MSNFKTTLEKNADILETLIREFGEKYHIVSYTNSVALPLARFLAKNDIVKRVRRKKRKSK